MRQPFRRGPARDPAHCQIRRAGKSVGDSTVQFPMLEKAGERGIFRFLVGGRRKNGQGNEKYHVFSETHRTAVATASQSYHSLVPLLFLHAFEQGGMEDLTIRHSTTKLMVRMLIYRPQLSSQHLPNGK